MSDDERRHCEKVAHEVLNGHVSARDWCTCGDLNCDKYGAFAKVADLIQRERAGLLARAEAAEAELRTTLTKTHAAQDEASAKLSASEARVAELEASLSGEASANSRRNRDVDELLARAEKAEAAAGQMREQLRGLLGWSDDDVNRAIGDAGRGYLSPEQVARERAEAREAALEAAAALVAREQASGVTASKLGIFDQDALAAKVRALKSRP